MIRDWSQRHTDLALSKQAMIPTHFTISPFGILLKRAIS
jgi:hypothetical protein